MLALGTNGQVLTAGATAPQWTSISGLTAGLATTATNVAGGSAGSIVYQSGVGTTAMLAISTAGYFLTVNAGATAPQWTQTLGVTNGGTGVTTLTGVAFGNGTNAFTAATGAQISTALGTTNISGNAANVTGIVATNNGGTGLSSWTAGDIAYYSSGTALTKLALGTAGFVLTAGASAPQWTSVGNITAGIATTATQIRTTAQANNANYFPTFVDSNNASAAGELVYTTSSFSINPSTNVISFNGVALAGTVNSQSTVARFNVVTGNTDSLEISNVRGTAGADYTTAGFRIQQKVDSTWMGYIQFNGNTTGANNGGMSFGAGTTTVSANSVTERLRITSSGDVIVLNTTAVNSAITGALQVRGGLGVSGNVFVSGTVTATNFVGAFSGAVTGTASQVQTTAQATNATYFPTFVDANNASAASETLFTTSSFSINPATGAVSIAGTLTQSGGYAYLGSFNADPANAARPVFGGSSMALSWNFSGGNAEMNLWNTVSPSVYTSTGFRFLQQLTTSTQRDLIFFRQDGAVGFGGISNVGTAGQILQSNGAASPTWVSPSGLTAGIATQIQTTRQATNATYFPAFVDSNNASATGEAVFTTSSFAINPSTGAVNVSSLVSAGAVSAAGLSGFYSTTYASNVRNPIWRFANADTYGISYFQGSAGFAGTSIDTLGIHFGTATAAGSTVMFSQNGATYINGSLGVGTNGSGTTGEIRATNEITAYYSDRRLKENVKPIDNAVEKVLSLNGITYTPNDLARSFGYISDKTIVGLFADEVDAVLPEAVRPAPFDQDEDGNSKSGENYQTIQYEKIVPLLVEAIKEQQKQIAQLSEMVNKLVNK